MAHRPNRGRDKRALEAKRFGTQYKELSILLDTFTRVEMSSRCGRADGALNFAAQAFIGQVLKTYHISSLLDVGAEKGVLSSTLAHLVHDLTKVIGVEIADYPGVQAYFEKNSEIIRSDGTVCSFQYFTGDFLEYTNDPPCSAVYAFASSFGAATPAIADHIIAQGFEYILWVTCFDCKDGDLSPEESVGIEPIWAVGTFCNGGYELLLKTQACVINSHGTVCTFSSEVRNQSQRTRAEKKILPRYYYLLLLS